MGVAAYASFAVADLKDTEAGNLDLVALNQGGSDGVDGSVDYTLGVLLAYASLLGGSSDEFCLVHNYFPLFFWFFLNNY